MGTEPEQPLTLICNFPKACFYTLELNLEGLKILNVDIGVEWTLLIAFNRGKMESVKGSGIYEKYESMMKGYDMVAGYIADDRMFVVLDRFFRGEITDKALVESLSVLKLGKPYVAITEKACRNIRILEKKDIGAKERDRLRTVSVENRR